MSAWIETTFLTCPEVRRQGRTLMSAWIETATLEQTADTTAVALS